MNYNYVFGVVVVLLLGGIFWQQCVQAKAKTQSVTDEKALLKPLSLVAMSSGIAGLFQDLLAPEDLGALREVLKRQIEVDAALCAQLLDLLVHQQPSEQLQGGLKKLADLRALMVAAQQELVTADAAYVEALHSSSELRLPLRVARDEASNAAVAASLAYYAAVKALVADTAK